MKLVKSKLPIIIRSVSLGMLLTYISMLVVIYSARHDNNPSDVDALGAVLPAIVFVVLGVINICLLVLYAARLLKSRVEVDRPILLLVIRLILLIIMSPEIVVWVESL